MAGTKDSHVVEIPVDEEHKEKQQQQEQQLVTVSNPEIGILRAIKQHPLFEISESPGHLLLLKLWQREEDMFCRRIILKESRLESIKREIFQLCCFFLVFHGFFYTIVYSSSCSDDDDAIKSVAVCRKWWIPSAVSLATSLVLVFLVQVKLLVFWRVYRGVHRERNDNRTLTRCVLELRMKGSSFDLSKEPLSGKRMKSSSVEIKWKPVTWFSQIVLPGFQVHPLRILIDQPNSYCLFPSFRINSFFNLQCGDEAFGAKNLSWPLYQLEKVAVKSPRLKHPRGIEEQSVAFSSKTLTHRIHVIWN